MSPAETPSAIQQVLGSLNAEHLERAVARGGLVDGAILLARVHEDDGTSISVSFSDGMDWITRRGMLEAARDMEVLRLDDDDDDD